jgi:preprotein translocase subunit SecE
MSKVGSFFKEVRQEMQATSWPSGKEMRKNTASIFTVVILFALFFYASESIIVWLLSFI